jgi:hypothetical protein
MTVYHEGSFRGGFPPEEDDEDRQLERASTPWLVRLFALGLFVLMLFMLAMSISCGEEPYLTPGVYEATIKNERDTLPELWNSEGQTAEVSWWLREPSPDQYTMGPVNVGSERWKGKKEGKHVVFKEMLIVDRDCPEARTTTTIKLQPTASGFKGVAAYFGIWSCDPTDHFVGPYEIDWTIKGTLQAIEIEKEK